MASLCARCVLRAANNRHPHAYHVAAPPAVRTPCPACLGILQEPALRSAVAAVAALLPALSHASRFKINATLPPAASVVRHRALRLSRAPHVDPVSLREAVKWALCSRLASLGLRYCPDADLFVDLVYAHPETDPDIDFVANHALAPGKRKRDAAHSITTVSRVVDDMSDLDFRAAVPVPPPPVSTPATVTATLSTAPVLLAGRYNKSSRIVSQTPWFVDRPPVEPNGSDTEHLPRTKRTALSVEEVVTAGIRAVLAPEKATFTAGGREDVDVRMLGPGRPFVVEVVNPRIVPSRITPEMVARMAAVSAHTSSAVTLQDLRIVPKSYFARMREYESEKRKHYRCVVWVSSPLTPDALRAALEIDGGFVLHQKTPLRVLHRRTQAVRQRHIYEARVVRFVNPNFFVLDLVAQAGTYIKEFVHGDNGRTVPNVAKMLGCDADILQLDVTRISRLNND